MTVASPTINPYGWLTAATFRTEAKKISDSLQAVGMVRADDTGQIDWATVDPAGKAANTLIGYEIFRFNGPAQTARPMFLKVEYLLGASTSWGSVVMSTGTSTDGAGTLTGAVSTRVGTANSVNYPPWNGQQTCLFSSDGDTYVWCQLFPRMQDAYGGATAVGLLYLVDRARNTDGSANPDGALILTQSSSTARSQMMVYTGQPSSGFNTNKSCAFFGGFPTNASGNDFILFPHFFASPKVYSASPVALGYFNNEITKGVIITVLLYGANKGFYTMGADAASHSIENSGTHGLALRWDA